MHTVARPFVKGPGLRDYTIVYKYIWDNCPLLYNRSYSILNFGDKRLFFKEEHIINCLLIGRIIPKTYLIELPCFLSGQNSPGSIKYGSSKHIPYYRTGCSTQTGKHNGIKAPAEREVVLIVGKYLIELDYRLISVLG